MSRYDDEIWELVPDPGSRPSAHIEHFVASLAPAGTALDLGCGDGRLSASLQAQELCLADVSGVALARAARRLPSARTVLLEPDAPLPLPDNAFELVLCAETLEHVRDVQLLLSEARRVLIARRPAGGDHTGPWAPDRAEHPAAGVRAPVRPALAPPALLHARSLEGVLETLGFPCAARSAAGTLLALATR